MNSRQSDTAVRGNNQTIDRRLCIAPMMDWTDRYCRLFHRLVAPAAFRFTEMVTAEAILHGDTQRLLAQAAPATRGEWADVIKIEYESRIAAQAAATAARRSRRPACTLRNSRHWATSRA